MVPSTNQQGEVPQAEDPNDALTDLVQNISGTLFLHQ